MIRIRLSTALLAYGLEGPSASSTVDNLNPQGIHLRNPKTCPNKPSHLSADVVRDFFEPVVVHDWSEETLAAIATQCDLAVIPLALTDPFATGKPENKLLLFWRLGVPVLTTATPAYRRAMQGAGLDMTCSSEADWEKYILRCIAEADFRRKAGEAGRRYTESVHPESRLLQSWDAVFESVL